MLWYVVLILASDRVTMYHPKRVKGRSGKNLIMAIFKDTLPLYAHEMIHQRKSGYCGGMLSQFWALMVTRGEMDG